MKRGLNLIELLIVILIFAVFVSFVITAIAIATKGQQPSKSDLDTVNTFEHDGCEYVAFSFEGLNWYLSGVTHKGNCKYCQKRLQETIEQTIEKLAEVSKQ